LEEAAWIGQLRELDALVERRGFAAAWARVHLLGPAGLAAGGGEEGVARWFAGVAAQAAAGRPLGGPRGAALARRGFGGLAGESEEPEEL
jgi:hypothetical protein